MIYSVFFLLFFFFIFFFSDLSENGFSGFLSDSLCDCKFSFYFLLFLFLFLFFFTVLIIDCIFLNLFSFLLMCVHI